MMAQPSALGDRRFQRKNRFWKTFAIIQFFILLWIFLNKNNFIDTTILPSTKLEKLSTLKNVDSLQNGNAQLKWSDLEMFHSQTELNLVRKIRDTWLKPPSRLPYNITLDTTTDLTAVKRLHKIVLEQFGGKSNRFFIECGAFDGVDLSNTLHLEQEFNWTGLLVEADPKYYDRLATRQRKAWTINACLSTKPYEEIVGTIFEITCAKVQMTRIGTEDALSRISDFAKDKFRKRPEAEEFNVQCFPLTSILAALGQPLNIDYFSLDVEGAEFDILQAIPWNFVNIKVISLEANEKHMKPVVKFLASKRFQFLTLVNGPWVHDYVFVNKQFMHDRNFAPRNESDLFATETSKFTT